MIVGVINYILVAVEVISSILLIGAILLQKTKGQGIGLAFGSGMGEAIFGSRAGNVLTRATVVLAVVFLVNTTLLALIGTRQRSASSLADTMDGAPTSGAPPGVPGSPPSGPGSGLGDLPPVGPGGTPAGPGTVEEVPIPPAEATQPPGDAPAVPDAGGEPPSE